MATSNTLYTNDVSIHYSTKRYMFQLFRSIINYKCIKQSIITTSITKAKLLALAYIYAWLLQQGRFFINIDLDINKDLTTLCNNL